MWAAVVYGKEILFLLIIKNQNIKIHFFIFVILIIVYKALLCSIIFVILLYFYYIKDKIKNKSQKLICSRNIAFSYLFKY